MLSFFDCPFRLRAWQVIEAAASLIAEEVRASYFFNGSASALIEKSSSFLPIGISLALS